ncbi:MAG: DUF4358 domain-containing protein [Ruminococcaceae bacterium]|jgi:hypothetical protein|nr:DUF4358 domain-containing protein [Oscillospiraceae bacterium]
MKRVCSLVLAVILALGVTACGGEKAKDVDVPGLATALATQVKFDSELKTLTAEQLGNYVTLPEGTEAAGYMSGGTTAEEIIVAKCASESDAKALKESIESFLADQRAEMERYLPQETARLEKAVLAQKGSCVVLCVSTDTDTVEQIIKEHLG